MLAQKNVKMLGMQKIIIILTLTFLVATGAFYLFSTKNTEQQSSSATSTSATLPTDKKAGFTMSDVATHADASSCWTVVKNKVYDLTSMINKHKGGSDAILSICGKDGTQAFSNMHGEKPQPNTLLNSMLIGDLITN